MAVNTGLKRAFSFLLETLNSVFVCSQYAGAQFIFDYCFVDLFVSASSRL